MYGATVPANIGRTNDVAPTVKGNTYGVGLSKNCLLLGRLVCTDEAAAATLCRTCRLAHVGCGLVLLKVASIVTSTTTKYSPHLQYRT